uniref:Uncharacterized protein n=1 Tax=Arundo donax TaxID=35708 RepID=A0A0A9FII8_ARUDO
MLYLKFKFYGIIDDNTPYDRKII